MSISSVPDPGVRFRDGRPRLATRARRRTETVNDTRKSASSVRCLPAPSTSIMLASTRLSRLRLLRPPLPVKALRLGLAALSRCRRLPRSRRPERPKAQTSRLPGRRAGCARPRRRRLRPEAVRPRVKAPGRPRHRDRHRQTLRRGGQRPASTAHKAEKRACGLGAAQPVGEDRGGTDGNSEGAPRGSWRLGPRSPGT